MSTPRSRYQDSFTHKPVKAELLDSDTENDEPIITKPFEAYEDSGFESVMYLENNSIKHYPVSGCENPYGPTQREPLAERRDQSVNRDTRQQPLTPTGTPIKNLPFSPSQVCSATDDSVLLLSAGGHSFVPPPLHTKVVRNDPKPLDLCGRDTECWLTQAVSG